MPLLAVHTLLSCSAPACSHFPRILTCPPSCLRLPPFCPPSSLLPAHTLLSTCSLFILSQYPNVISWVGLAVLPCLEHLHYGCSSVLDSAPWASVWRMSSRPPLPSLMLADSVGIQLLSWTLLTLAPASIPRYLSSAWALWDTLHMNFLQFEPKHNGWFPSYFLPARKVFLQELRFGT